MSEPLKKKRRVTPGTQVRVSRLALIQKRVSTNVLSNASMWKSISQWLDITDVRRLNDALSGSIIFAQSPGTWHSELEQQMSQLKFLREINIGPDVNEDTLDWFLDRLTETATTTSPTRIMRIQDSPVAAYANFWTNSAINQLYDLEIDLGARYSWRIRDALLRLSRVLTRDALLRRLVIMVDEYDYSDLSLAQFASAVRRFFSGEDGKTIRVKTYCFFMSFLCSHWKNSRIFKQHGFTPQRPMLRSGMVYLSRIWHGVFLLWNISI
jgi:hypothetical protein